MHCFFYNYARSARNTTALSNSRSHQYIRVYIKVRCDRNWRVELPHKDQKVQMSNTDARLKVPLGTQLREAKGPSVYYESIFIQHVGYQDLKNGDDYNVVWTRAYEARPSHINRRYGTNREEKICTVQFPELAFISS